jgi:ferredoxin, 2Fe-2S
MVSFYVTDTGRGQEKIEIPDDINLSLMEVLKASDYEIPATCGGIALCATCHVEVLKGEDLLGNPSDAELDMIDTLPNAKENSRLACQIRISQQLEGACFRVVGSSSGQDT